MGPSGVVSTHWSTAGSILDTPLPKDFFPLLQAFVTKFSVRVWDQLPPGHGNARAHCSCRPKAFLYPRSLNNEGFPPHSLLEALRVTDAPGAGWRTSPCTRNVTDPGARGEPGSRMYEMMGRK